MGPDKRSTMGFIGEIFARYPIEVSKATLFILLASLAEAAGVITLIPLLGEVISTAASVEGAGVVSQTIRRAFELVGIPYNMGTLLILITTSMIAKGLFQWIAWRQAGLTVAKVASDFRLSLVASLFRADWAYLTQKKIGALANSLGQEVYGASRAYLGVCQFFAASSLVLVYVAVVALLSPQALLFLLIMTLLLVVPLRGILRFSSSVAKGEVKAQKSFVSNLINALQSIKPIRAMGAEAEFENLAAREADELRSAVSKQISAAYLMPVLQEPTLVVSIATALWVGRTMLGLEFSALALIGFSLWRAGLHVNVAHAAFRSMLALEPYYWSLRDVISASREAREADPGTHKPPPSPIGIEVDRLSFGYGPTAVLEDISLTIPANKVTALVGESGAGKTTLIDLLLGLRKPHAGDILVNGISLQTISKHAWRQKLGYVPQETTLFHDTIMENVRLGDTSIDESQVRASLEHANAWAFVAAMEDGVHTVIGEQGSRLSGGERQRIAIARAVVRRPAVLILDEFTAALDQTAQVRAAELVKRLKGTATILLATHQPALLEAADIVYRLEGSGVTKVGRQA